jgi:hypothetical protein
MPDLSKFTTDLVTGWRINVAGRVHESDIERNTSRKAHRHELDCEDLVLVIMR